MAIQIMDSIPSTGSAIDGSQDNDFSVIVRFSTKVGTITSGSVEFRNSSNNSLLHTITSSSLLLGDGDNYSVTLPGGTISNGLNIYYKITLSDGTESKTSRPIAISTRLNPTINLTVPETLNNQKITINPTYTGNSIEITRHILYDNEDNIIESQDTGLVTGGNLSHTFSGLANGQNYGVETIVIDNTGYTVRTGIQRFNVSYLLPNINIPLNIVYDKILTANRVTWSVLSQVIATVTNGFKYVTDFIRTNNTSLELERNATWQATVDIPKDFTVKKIIMPYDNFEIRLSLDGNVNYKFGHDGTRYYLQNQEQTIYSRDVKLPLSPFYLILERDSAFLKIYSRNIIINKKEEEVFSFPTDVIKGRIALSEIQGNSYYNLLDMDDITVIGEDNFYDEKTGIITFNPFNGGNTSIGFANNRYRMANTKAVVIGEILEMRNYENGVLTITSHGDSIVSSNYFASTIPSLFATEIDFSNTINSNSNLVIASSSAIARPDSLIKFKIYGLISGRFNNNTTNNLLYNSDYNRTLSIDDNGNYISIRNDGFTYFLNSFSTNQKIINLRNGRRYFVSLDLTDDSTSELRENSLLFRTSDDDDIILSDDEVLNSNKSIRAIYTSTYSGDVNLKLIEGTSGNMILKYVTVIDLTDENEMSNDLSFLYEKYVINNNKKIKKTLRSEVNNIDLNYRIKSMSKNLFDGVWNTEYDFITEETVSGVEYYVLTLPNNAPESVINILPNVKFKSNTRYTITLNAYETNDSMNTRLTFYYTDGIEQNIFLPTLTEQQFIATSYENKTIQHISIRATTRGGQTYIRKNTFQIEEGTQSTEYEPYRSSEQTLILNNELNGLQNDIYDTYDDETGILTKRIGEYTVTESDIVTFNTIQTEVDSVSISFNNLEGYVGLNGRVYEDTILVYGFSRYDRMDILNTVRQIGKFRVDANNTFIIITPKGYYSNLSEARTSLAGLKVLYELDEESQSSNKITPFLDEGYIKSFENATNINLESYHYQDYTTETTTITLDDILERIVSIQIQDGEDFNNTTGTLSDDGKTITVSTSGTYRIRGISRDRLVGNIDFSYPIENEENNINLQF